MGKLLPCNIAVIRLSHFLSLRSGLFLIIALYRDFGQVLRLGLERGLEQGLEQGLERGLEQGLEKGRLEMFRVAIKSGAHPNILDAMAKAAGINEQQAKAIHEQIAALS